MEMKHLSVTLSRADFCVICSTVEEDAESDIRERKIHGIPVFLVIEELFGLKIDAADRVQKRLPYKLCSKCTPNVSRAYNLRTQVWKMQSMVDEWEQNMEPEETFTVEQYVKQEEIEFEDLIEIKDEPIEESGEEVFCPEATIAKSKMATDNQIDYVEPVRPYACPYCELTFWTEKIAQLHEAVHQKEESFVCKICNYQFTLKRNAKTHIRKKHPKSHPDTSICKINLPVKRRVYPCNECNETFKTLKLVKLHKQSVHRRNYVCSICQLTFKYAANARLHICDKHPDSPVEESYFPLCVLLNRPEKLPGEAKFSCSVCDAKFTYKFNANKHMLQKHPHVPLQYSAENSEEHYSVEKVFDCKRCGEKFEKMSLMKAHQRIHTDNFLCKVCKAPFRYNHHARKHVREKHPKEISIKNSIEAIGESALKKPVTGTFSCNICKSIFMCIFSARRHVREEHPTALSHSWMELLISQNK